MTHFISCDWGTSYLRLRVIHASTKTVLAKIQSAQGIAATHALWQASGSMQRLPFYSNIILQQIVLLQQQYGRSIYGLAVIISGMASAGIGMLEMPYRPIPFHIREAGYETHLIPATDAYPHSMYIISGVRSHNSVMRGEETILAGCAVDDTAGEQLFILPGTHSKHVTIVDGVIESIQTFMTGEVFALLSEKIMLAASVEKEDTLQTVTDAFIEGVAASAVSGLLNNIFQVRINSLFGILGAKENYRYLSGLLIGEELKDLSQSGYQQSPYCLQVLLPVCILQLCRRWALPVIYCSSMRYRR